MKTFLKINKWVLFFIVGLIIFFIGTTILMSFTQRQLLIDAHKKSLQILANEKAFHINIFLENQKEKQEIIASMNVFKEAVRYPNDTAKIEIAKDRINELSPMIHRMAIFTKEGLMFIAESGPVPIDYSALPYFVSKDKYIVFVRYYDNFQKKDYYSIFGPIYDNADKSKIIGAIAFDVELDKISTLMKETLDVDEPEEIYLIDETGLLLSGSKYIGEGNKNGILIQKVQSDGAIECLGHVNKYGKNEFVEEHREEVIQYINYMGDEVFGAHAYVPLIMGCVVAEEGIEKILGSSMADFIINLFKN